MLSEQYLNKSFSQTGFKTLLDSICFGKCCDYQHYQQFYLHFSWERLTNCIDHYYFLPLVQPQAKAPVVSLTMVVEKREIVIKLGHILTNTGHGTQAFNVKAEIA